MDQHLLDWLAHYGPVVLFFAQVAGIFGLPIPDELLTVSGALVRKGEFSAGAVIVAAIAGSASGITLSYVLGRTAGSLALREWVHVPEESLARAQTLFRRFGGWLLMFGFFIPGVRHVTAILAGSTPLDYPTFAKFAYPGAAVWSLTFLTLGYYAGTGWRPALMALRPWLPLFGLLIIIAGTMVILARRRHTPM